MLDLAKFIKQLKDFKIDFLREISEKMKEAMHLIVSGAILCHSFIACNTISRIREELVYVRGKMDRIKQDLHFQIQLTICHSVTFYMSRQQQHNDNEGEIEKPCEKQTHKMEMQSDTESSLSESNGQVEYGFYKKKCPLTDNSKSKNRNQPQAFLPRLMARPARMLKTIAHGQHKITGHKFRGRENSVHSDLGITLVGNQRSSFAIEHGLGWLPLRFAYRELKIATNGFNNKIGSGGFSDVYKGILANGRQVVVKRPLNRQEIFSHRFQYLTNELVCIASLHHRHILKLVGFCIERKELMLVYDYMPHGTLSDILFDPIKKQVLDWSRRFKIILEVVSVLAFLTNGAYVRIVHRDIKPSNVLLDENFSARLFDFGFAITLQDDNDERDIRVAGTFGYVDPAHVRTACVTEKTDIYSFGILVLNVVSGKKALEFTSVDDGLHELVEQARMLQKENRLIELIDPDLVKGPGFDSGDILRTLMIAMLCVQKDPDLRPPASRVLVMLSTKEVEIPTAPVQLPLELNDVSSSTFTTTSSSIIGHSFRSL